MDRGAWRAAVHGVAASWTGLRLYFHFSTHMQFTIIFCENNCIGNKLQLPNF